MSYVEDYFNADNTTGIIHVFLAKKSRSIHIGKAVQDCVDYVIPRSLILKIFTYLTVKDLHKQLSISKTFRIYAIKILVESLKQFIDSQQCSRSLPGWYEPSLRMENSIPQQVVDIVSLDELFSEHDSSLSFSDLFDSALRLFSKDKSHNNLKIIFQSLYTLSTRIGLLSANDRIHLVRHPGGCSSTAVGEYYGYIIRTHGGCLFFISTSSKFELCD
ncbi:tRNA dimethylallyltransferase [Acrasis kona]|uniref:tRNA dimethylallyltransferase n=1 Tax=Acrasis kona TaxID=1008807 RepID=A0AAW2ZEK5_9EUKA